MTRRIAVVTAGLSQPSSTRLLADRISDAVGTAVTARGAAADIDAIELRDLATDLATAMTVGGLPTPALAQARERLSSADGLIAVTPVFTGSYSGLFKMFFDAVDTDALGGMPTIVAATGGSALGGRIRRAADELAALVVAAPAGVGGIRSHSNRRPPHIRTCTAHHGDAVPGVAARPHGMSGGTAIGRSAFGLR
ncbi:oxidoreductase [Rhodococcus zopfii]|uniref:Oxidoreductase n=1 Tax=Rhodococcus zopfii TaxID=43772 RepID=A0ABU3WMZ4_9NOCA|nr:oxidoreductase [Rhodococcus zopfii]